MKEEQAMACAARGHRFSARSERGFTLIEALIAFVILSVGLLGIVSLQAMAKTSQHLALQHTRAVTLADAIVERIRVNPAGIEAYDIGTANAVGDAPTAEPSPDCRTAACTPTELALHDLWTWEQALLGAGAKVGAENTAGLIAPRGCHPGPGSHPHRSAERDNSMAGFAGVLRRRAGWRGRLRQ